MTARYINLHFTYLLTCVRAVLERIFFRGMGGDEDELCGRVEMGTNRCRIGWEPLRRGDT